MINSEIVVIDNRTSWMPGIREIWQYRNLALLMAYRSIRVRYKQAALGFLWAIMVPISFAFIFFLFFRLAPVNVSGSMPYLPVVYLGMIFWQFFSRVVLEGGISLAANAQLISKVYFPRLILPFSIVLAALFDLLISMIPLLLLIKYSNLSFTVNMLFVPLFMMWIGLLSFSLALLMAAVDARYRDLRHAMPILLQLGMFASPVVYSSFAIVPEKWLSIYSYNPLVAPLEGLRWALLNGSPTVQFDVYIKSISVTLLVALLGVMLFTRVEKTIVDNL